MIIVIKFIFRVKERLQTLHSLCSHEIGPCFARLITTRCSLQINCTLKINIIYHLAFLLKGLNIIIYFIFIALEVTKVTSKNNSSTPLTLPASNYHENTAVSLDVPIDVFADTEGNVAI